MEKLTHELIESHLMGIFEFKSNDQGNRVVRWAWDFAPQAERFPTFDNVPRYGTVGDIDAFRFSSYEAARNYAMGWVRRNRPSWWDAAKREAEAGIRYRATRKHYSGARNA